jgi:hypothetical protein
MRTGASRGAESEWNAQRRARARQRACTSEAGERTTERNPARKRRQLLATLSPAWWR